MGEASEDPDLLLYLEENVNSLTSTDVASLLDYQVYFGTRQNLFTPLKETFETLKQRKALIRFNFFIYFQSILPIQCFQGAWFTGGEPGGSRGTEGGVHQGDPRHPLQLCSTTQERGDMLSLWN